MGKRPLFSNFSFLQLISFENLAFLISNDSIKDGQSLEMDVYGRGYAPPWRGMSENLKKKWPEIYKEAYVSSLQELFVELINDKCTFGTG